jgi:hypothetical protein
MHHLQCEESRRTHQPHPPFSNPVMPGHEGSTNVWFCPDKGLYYDKTWRMKVGICVVRSAWHVCVRLLRLWLTVVRGSWQEELASK